MIIIKTNLHILNETSKPPVNKTHFFQYNSFINNLFEMIFDIVYLDTCMRRLNITPFDSIRMLIFNVTIEYLYLFCMWHTNAKCFSLIVYSYFHRQLSDNFILSQKCQRLGCMSIK